MPLGETIEDYVAALRQLVVTCGWNCAACSNADENIRDQIIEKTNSEQIRERLLLEENLTLTRTLELASQVECAMREAKSFASTSSTNKLAQESVNKVKFHSKKPQKKKYTRKSQPSKQAPATKVCYRCGSSEYMANSPSCPAVTNAVISVAQLDTFPRYVDYPVTKGRYGIHRCPQNLHPNMYNNQTDQLFVY